jgi:FkbM family methyltransferase
MRLAKILEVLMFKIKYLKMLKNIKTINYIYRYIFKPDTIKNFGVNIFVRDSNISNWVRDAIYKGFYEAAEAKLLIDYLSENDVVLEIGGGIGFIGSICLTKAKQVTIYEANPKLIPIINHNCKLNGKNFSVYNYAVVNNSDKREIKFYIGENFWNASIFKTDGFKETTVPSISMNEIVHNLNPSFLIIDVEGYEVELLKKYSFPNSIKKLLIEFHPKKVFDNEIKELKNNIMENNFKLVERSLESELFKRV